MKVRPDDSAASSDHSVTAENATQMVNRMRWIWFILGSIQICVGLAALPIVTSPSLMIRYGYNEILPIIFSVIGLLVGMGVVSVLTARYLPSGKRNAWKIAVIISLLYMALGTATIFTIMQGWLALFTSLTSIRNMSALSYIIIGATLLALLGTRRVRKHFRIYYGSKKRAVVSVFMTIAIVAMPTFAVFYGYAYSTGVFVMREMDYANKHDFIANSLYSPEGTTEWSIAADMPTPRDEGVAAVIENRIYVVGGHDATTFASNKVEVYDIANNTWSEVKELPEALDHAGVASYDGKLYVVGGLTADFQAARILFIFDPTTNEWTRGNDMPTARGAMAAQFVNGMLYTVGGWNNEPLRANEAYDPASDTWVTKAPMPTARDHVASGVVNDKLYVIGGRQGSLWKNVNVNEEYDPENDEWSTKAPVPSYRGGLTGASLSDSIYVFGGENPVRTFDNNEQYIPSLDKWIIRESLPTARHGLASAVVDGSIYVIGGSLIPGSSLTGKNEVFTPIDWRISENDNP